MVLTNFELWAADGSSVSSLPLDFESNNTHARHLNPFDPRFIPQLNANLNHLSSNGYYGFSYVNASHNTELNNNNNNDSHINYNNNNNTISNLMANEVGINNTFTTPSGTTQQTHASPVNFGSSAQATGHGVTVMRCKKRCFDMNDDNDVESDCTANKNYYSNNSEISAKRCRFDDDFSAEYCNDFFQLPSTQIATQSCLMDTEEEILPQHHHQQQVDEAIIFENNNNNIEKIEHTLKPQLQNLSDHQHQHQQQLQSEQQQQQQEPQQQHLYHQQQHYQGHLHRANRDVSRCMLSHMI